MPDDTKMPPNELPPSDQPWGEDIAEIRKFLSGVSRVIFEYYNSLCEAGLSRQEALALIQVFQSQYWAVVLNIIYHGKTKTSD